MMSSMNRGALAVGLAVVLTGCGASLLPGSNGTGGTGGGNVGAGGAICLPGASCALGTGGLGGKDGGPDANGGVVAVIRVSASTNSAEVDVTVYADGSANRTIGPARNSDLDGKPAIFLPGQPAVAKFVADLDAVGNVAAIPIGQCGKSVSFGTTTTVTAGGQTSGDLQCLDNPTAAETSLAADCDALATGSPQETFDGGASARDGG